jgi:hypothetical protein
MPSTITAIGTEIKAIIDGVTEIETAWDYMPAESELAVATLPACSLSYMSFRTDDLRIWHKFLVGIYFSPNKNKVATTEVEVRDVTQKLFEAFAGNCDLNHTVMNAYPQHGATDYITYGQGQMGGKLLCLALFIGIDAVIARENH